MTKNCQKTGKRTLLRGVNDDPTVLGKLLASAGWFFPDAGARGGYRCTGGSAE